MNPNQFSLPIDEVVGTFCDALHRHGRVVLQAPPGAGKTTRIPLAIRESSKTTGRILMLEPRRLAARAAAERMARTLGENVGETVGYRIKGEVKSGKNTRIEVVTEGILTRMIQSDPELSGVDTIIFDEFHERSLNADLGLALCWEIKSALRDDLQIVVMSATLDAAPVAALLDDCPIITSEGRSFPVETRHLPKPIARTAKKRGWFEDAAASLIETAVNETEGGVLVFLPGEGEIRRVETRLKGRVPSDCHIHTLFGAMNFKSQRAAIAPAKSGRKIVLATAIAETSLTIEDVRVVVDCGRARRARFDPSSGMSRLVTEPVSRAEAEQRRGRAGRVAEGTCYRMWTKGEEGALSAFPPAEIESTDLASLVLELALWGAVSADELAFLTPPSNGAMIEARRLLQSLGALDDEGRISSHGKQIARLPLHPRLAHMLLQAGDNAIPLAALINGRDPIRDQGCDIRKRLELIRAPSPKNFGAELNHAAFHSIKDEMKSLTKSLKGIRPPEVDYSEAEMIALAYPDRIAMRRPGGQPRYILSGGKGAFLADDDPLAGARMLVVSDLDGDAKEARIRQAVQIDQSSVERLFSDQLIWVESCEWSRRERKVLARKQQKLGALTLSDTNWKDAPDESIANAALDGFRDIGLPVSAATARFLSRVALFPDDLPDMSIDKILDDAEEWLLPHIAGLKTENQLRAFDPLPALKQRLNWEQTKLLDQLAPASFVTPLGHKTPIDYSGEAPEISVRLQEMFGVTEHPTVGKNRTPLRITLLSPARRPLQTTADLPGFWANSYADVRKDMRGQYPKHPWPEDPTKEAPTLRAKRRQ
ncbi:ATP-dependent helicase HrpB [Halocynthiibacter sp. C4]|uniref:ATP-dependent helicase HrpB n=1 Tax=Halocynthiibacter sp. C4 TaxID=2992758 RepID=UPI00237A4922|nr:ATP-dependent helicase HrpB [Halocynthiibacter sp. C4]MDE0588759.1 ATP-dependent helicase HrpB [Halocynthiibacter sp. C4]